MPRFSQVNGVEDGFSFDASNVQCVRTWEEKENPALKFTVRYTWLGPPNEAANYVKESSQLRNGENDSRATTHAIGDQITIDFGWGDPLSLPAVPTLIASTFAPSVRALAVRPETLFAWKLHGLFENEQTGLSAAGVPKVCRFRHVLLKYMFKNSVVDSCSNDLFDLCTCGYVVVQAPPHHLGLLCTP